MPRLDSGRQRWVDFEIALFLEAELEKYRIDPMLLMGVLDDDQKDIEGLSLVVIERLAERNGKKRTTQSRGCGIPDSLANYLTVAAAEAACRAGVMPEALTQLIKNRLCGPTPLVHRQYEAHLRYKTAVILAAQLDGDITVRKLSRRLGVSTGQVGKWLKGGRFRRDVEIAKEMLSCADVSKLKKLPPKKVANLAQLFSRITVHPKST